MPFEDDDMDLMNAMMTKGFGGKGKGGGLPGPGDYYYFPFIPRAGTWNVDKSHMKKTRLKSRADPLMMMWNPYNPERWDDNSAFQASPFVRGSRRRGR